MFSVALALAHCRVKFTLYYFSRRASVLQLLGCGAFAAAFKPFGKQKAMAIDKLTAIESVLAQMRAVSGSAQARGVFSANETQQASGSSGGFAAELSRTLEKVASMQNASAAQARAFQMGEPGVSLNNVMVDMQKASIAFQTTVQMRNRLVSAYQEIASMPI